MQFSLKPHPVAKAALMGIMSVAGVAAAQDETAAIEIAQAGGQDGNTQEVAPTARESAVADVVPRVVGVAPNPEPEAGLRRWRGSVLIFDQSVTATTVGLGPDYQSSNPVYEWWFAFKPRYAIYKSKVESFTVSLWMNLYLELTNSDSTTTEHEPVVGPTTLQATYGRNLFEGGGYKTKVSVGPRFGIPTDKASRNSGQILGLGLSAGLSQTIPLAGEDAATFPEMHFGVNSNFNHPIGPKVPIYSGLRQLRQNITDTRTVISDVLRGSMNVANSVSLALSGDVLITQKLGFSLSYSFLNSWTYTGRDACVYTPLTCATPMRIDNPTTYRASNWVTASFDYDATDELSVSLGYYNLAGQTGPDAQRRNPLWSPDSRLFLTFTGNLDAIYNKLSTRQSPVTTASARR